jgi:secondary thiamine-phosphate synthase enzyme
MFTQSFEELSIKTNGNKLIKLTEKVLNFVDRSKISNGILNISILHTSASLIIQENADDDVQKDILNFYHKLVPMDENLYIHNTEGKDDMPAHIKSTLTNSNLTLSVKNNRLILGTWQGIYLFEHRIEQQIRKVFLHILRRKVVL